MAEDPDSSSFKERTVREFVDRIGDKVVEGDIHGETGSGEPVQGLQCQHGTHFYVVLWSPSWEYAYVRFSFSGDEAWHIRHSSSELSETGQVDVSHDDLIEARQNLEDELEAQPPSEKRELRLNLMRILSTEGCSLTLDTSDSNPLNIHGFNVDRKIFPEDDSFTVSDFDEAVQTVINLGWVGKDFLIENYGLRFEE